MNYFLFDLIKHIKQSILAYFMGFTQILKGMMQVITGSDEEKEQIAEQIAYDDVRKVFLEASKQLEQGIRLGEAITIPDASQLQHITFVGMGGSSNHGFLMKTYLENIGCQKPIHIVRDYFIPPYISKKGFFIVSSYSGNTEETIAAYQQAYKENYSMFVMTSGGALKELAEKNGIPVVPLPAGYQPRHSLFFMFGALLRIFQNSGIIERHAIKDNINTIAKTIQILQKPLFEEMGKHLAEKISGKIPIIYTTPKLGEVGQRWKISFNENAKIHAFCNQLPELDHNEINSYVTKQMDFHVFFLVDEEETKEHKKRISVTKQLIKEHGYPATELIIKGPTYLARLLSAVYIGDWISYYYALQLGVDPCKVEIIERLKKMLEETKYNAEHK